MMRLIAFLAALLPAASARATSYSPLRDGRQYNCQRRLNSDPFSAGSPL
jgi:hypothetical protein